MALCCAKVVAVSDAFGAIANEAGLDIKALRRHLGEGGDLSSFPEGAHVQSPPLCTPGQQCLLTLGRCSAWQHVHICACAQRSRFRVSGKHLAVIGSGVKGNDSITCSRLLRQVISLPSCSASSIARQTTRARAEHVQGPA